MSQIYMHINATIVSTEEKISQKGNSYLKVLVRDEFRNTMSMCDMNATDSEKYLPNTKGDMLVRISQTYSHDKNTYTNISIEDFVPES